MSRWTCLGKHEWEADSPSSCCPRCNRRASAEVRVHQCAPELTLTDVLKIKAKAFQRTQTNAALRQMVFQLCDRIEEVEGEALLLKSLNSQHSKR